MFNSISMPTFHHGHHHCDCDHYCPHCGRRKVNPWPPPPVHPWEHRHWPIYIEPNVGNPYNPTRPQPGRWL